MAVKIGSARIDENGRISGGKAGDQTGSELGIQDYYLHSKGWDVLRAKDTAVAEKIALCMADACANPYIGYDQDQRNTLYNAVKDNGFKCDIYNLKKNVETDCSALIRVNVGYAGIKIGDVYTGNLKDTLLATGKFELVKCDMPNGLKRGDILVTKKKGHTVVVLSNGSGVPKDNSKLVIDGEWGVDTTCKSQKVLGTTVDGIISNQIDNLKDYVPNALVSSWEFEKSGYEKGSELVKAIQKLVGAEIDGHFGGDTVEALQRFLNKKGYYTGSIDRVMGPNTVKAWQKYLNSRV